MNSSHSLTAFSNWLMLVLVFFCIKSRNCIMPLQKQSGDAIFFVKLVSNAKKLPVKYLRRSLRLVMKCAKNTYKRSVFQLTCFIVCWFESNVLCDTDSSSSI
jgi:hypothetical protein